MISSYRCVCFQGFFCDSRLANASLLRPCPEGHYCPAGTSLPNQYPCPTGTFNPRQATHSPSDCMLCGAGQHCPSAGLTQPAGWEIRIILCLYSAAVLMYQCIKLQHLIKMGCLPCRTMPRRLLVQRWSFLSHSSGWILRLTMSSWSLLPPRFQWTQLHALYHHCC